MSDFKIKVTQLKESEESNEKVHTWPLMEIRMNSSIEQASYPLFHHTVRILFITNVRNESLAQVINLIKPSKDFINAATPGFD